jgi:hypothetical protein
MSKPPKKPTVEEARRNRIIEAMKRGELNVKKKNKRGHR